MPCLNHPCSWEWLKYVEIFIPPILKGMVMTGGRSRHGMGKIPPYPNGECWITMGGSTWPSGEHTNTFTCFWFIDLRRWPNCGTKKSSRSSRIFSYTHMYIYIWITYDDTPNKFSMVGLIMLVQQSWTTHIDWWIPMMPAIKMVSGDGGSYGFAFFASDYLWLSNGHRSFIDYSSITFWFQ